MMVVKVKYFGAIAEVTGVSEEVLELEAVDSSVQKLSAFCLQKYPQIGNLSFQIAVNQKISINTELSDNDEVAFLPPFAGG
jgi:molybdopterin synthase sulfur carrier subunit